MAKNRSGAWIPSNALEEEVISLQPHHDFIYGSNFAQNEFYSIPLRPRADIEIARKQRESQELTQQLLKPLPTDQRDKLSAIIKTQNVINTKPLGVMPTIDDWNADKQCERDTVAMMRRLHLGPCTETPLNSQRTIGTVSTSEDYKLVKTKNGNLPVFLGENFFKMSPVSSEKAESDDLQISVSTPSTDSAVSVPDLITFNTTESSFDSLEENSNTSLREISYRILLNSSNSSFMSESSSGYGPAKMCPLADYIKAKPRKSKKNRKAEQKN